MKYAFKDIASNCTEKRIPTEEDRLTYIGLEHLDSRKLAITRYGSDVPLKGEKLVMKKGDILFGKRNTYLKRVAIAPFDGLFSAHGMVLRPNEKVISKEFFPFFLSSDYFLDEAIRISVGSLSPTVNWKDLRELEFEIPDFDKQHELALFLSSANELKESYEKMIAATDEMVKSQFIEQFSGRDNRKISDVCDIHGGSTPNRKVSEFWEGGTIPWFTVEDIYSQGKYIYSTKQHVTEEGAKKLYIYPVDTVLICCTASVGENAITKVPMGSNQQFNGLTARDKKELIPDFLLYVASTLKSKLLQLAGKTTINFVSRASLEGICIPVPEYHEQQRFVAFVRQADKSKFELKQAIEKIDKVMRALMQ